MREVGAPPTAASHGAAGSTQRTATPPPTSGITGVRSGSVAVGAAVGGGADADAAAGAGAAAGGPVGAASAAPDGGGIAAVDVAGAAAEGSGAPRSVSTPIWSRV